MNIPILVGIVGCCGVIVYGILLSGKMSSFVDIPSVAIVLGGTLLGMIAGTPLKDLKNIPKHIRSVTMSE